MPATRGITIDRAASHVAVFGAGIAGLTAAHELSCRGYRVSVYEPLAEAGGFFRSSRLTLQGNLPTEYSWHGMGPWYHNLYDLLKQIPLDESGSIYARGLSRPIDFGVFPEDAKARFYDRGLASIPQMFRFSRTEWLKWSWLMLKTWTAHHRTERDYSRLNAAEEWHRCLGEVGCKTWRACFGPWIGSDWTNVSLHQAGQFFRKQLITRPSHHHPADDEGPAWQHRAADGWLLLRGPSSEIWFQPWVRHLRTMGVRFHWNQALDHFGFDGRIITGAQLASGADVHADHYILATTPFAAAEILAKTTELERQDELRLFGPLIQGGPHVQVSFRIGFAEPIHFPRQRTAVVVADSEFNLTLFAQEQAWGSAADLGQGIRSLWTGTSCAGTVPGRLYHLPVTRCTKAQFIAEVKAQLLTCGSLDEMIRTANGGRGLADFDMTLVEIWHEWKFSPEGLTGPQPKWVNTTHTQPFQPRQATPVRNLSLAGAHTRTEADVWSIEGAVESGRRAARVVEPAVAVIGQYKPRWLRVLGAADDACYRLGAPHILDLALVVMIGGVAAAVVISLFW